MSNGVNCIFNEEDTSVVLLSKLTHEGTHEYLCTVAVFGIAVFPSLFHDSGIRNVGAEIPEFKKKRPLQESEKFNTTRYALDSLKISISPNVIHVVFSKTCLSF